MDGYTNRLRAEYYALAEYYAWAARRNPQPYGNDPRTGLPWDRFTLIGRAIGRAQYIGAARAAYQVARACYGPVPLP